MKRINVLAFLIQMREALEPYRVSPVTLVRKLNALAKAINNNLTS